VRGGILAAGLGERLGPARLGEPKALLRVAGRPLLRHALEAVLAAGAREARIAVNEHDAGRVERALAVEPPPLPVTLLLRSTASSLETFARLAPWLRSGGRHAIVSMVDGVFEPGAAAAFGREVARLAAAPEGPVDGLIGITDRADDDAPLRVAVDGQGRVQAIGPGAAGSPYATAGLYCLPARAFELAPAPAEAARARLRDFLAGLVGAGLRLRAHPLGKVVDVDRPDDLAEAEALQRTA
jgi:NDP-sugar pyrophosphorylase family protein